MCVRTLHWFLGLKILPTGLGFKVRQNAPFYTTEERYLPSIMFGEDHSSFLLEFAGKDEASVSLSVSQIKNVRG